MVIFTHIHKTAGHSLYRLMRRGKYRIQRKCHKKLRTDDPQIKDDVNFLSGHIPYGVHKKFGIRKPTYLVMLRDPIRRWISAFYHCAENPKMIGPLWNKCGHNIEKFIIICQKQGRNINLMTRQISGCEDINNCVHDLKNYAYVWGGRRNLESEEEMQHYLQTAKKHLRKHYKFIGFQETAYEDYQRLCTILKVSYKRLPKYKKTRRIGGIDFESKEIQGLLKECNKFDIELYNYARGLLL